MKYYKSAKTDKNLSFIFKALLLGVLIGNIVCTVFMILFALIFVKLGAISQVLVQSFTLVAASFGALSASYVALSIHKEKGLCFGALTGFLMFVIFTLVGFIVSKESFTSFTLIKFILLIFVGAIGGVLGANRKSRQF